MDASALLLAAERITEHSAVLRARARLIAAHHAALRWRSPAARAFGRRIDDVVGELAGGARRCDELAERMRRHAARVAAAP
jgi:hypothetical protein